MWGIEGADGMEGGLNVRGDGMEQWRKWNGKWMG
jgi:hypothetical protein